MAVSLSNHTLTLLFSPRASLSSSGDRRSTTLHSFLRRPPPPLHIGFPLISKSSTRSRFKPSFSINNEGVRDAEKATGSEASWKQPVDMKMLIEAYKEAVSNGNDKTLSDIEAVICIEENTKNDLLQKVSSLSAEITSRKEKGVRLQADFENFRKRLEKEKLTVRSDAQGEVIESLLLLVDSFERAKQHLKPETEKEKNIDTSYQGIYKQFVEIMRSMQVAAVPTVGKRFDPSVHEAIAREKSEEFKEGIVIEETRRGFLHGNRLLRPAMVKVSAGPGPQKASVASDKPAVQPVAAAGVDDQ